MTATILPFIRKRRCLFSTAFNPESWDLDNGSGVLDAMPSLWDMCQVLRENCAVLDERDTNLFFLLVEPVLENGDKASIESIIECRAIAWSILNRYKIAV